MNRTLSNILRVIEFSLDGNEEKCLRYAERIYDGLEKPEISKEDFLKMCSGYFHPEEPGWAVQDSEEEALSVDRKFKERMQHIPHYLITDTEQKTLDRVTDTIIMKVIRNKFPDKIAMIACVDKNMAIGNKGKLLYHIKEDMAMFKKLTIGHTVIMGMNTYKSLPHGALPNRRNIVISRSVDNLPDAEVFNNPFDALKTVNGNVFIIGGESIYKIFYPIADELYITEVHAEAEHADAYFPKIGEEFDARCAEFNKSSESGLEYSFVYYKRIKPTETIIN